MKKSIPFYDDANPDDLPDRVFVYRNLSAQRGRNSPVYSVMDSHTGRIVAHVRRIALEHAQFVVREGGRQRVLAEQRKNVHAGIRGMPAHLSPAPKVERVATYNPYKSGAFYDRETEHDVTSAPIAVLDATGVRYSTV